MLTRDQLAAWLAQVHADVELPAHLFKAAFALMQAADPMGFVRKSGTAKLVAAADVDALTRAAHLHPVPNGVRLALRAAKLRRQRTAHLIPFPSNRRRAFMEKQAQTMAKLSDEKAEAYLRSQLAIQGDSMRRKGIDEAAIGRTLRDLERAIRAELFRQALLTNPWEPA
jgi:hypothetical protein